MALSYRVWTEQEVKDRKIAPEGVYEFEILAAVPDKSKAGNDMLTIDLTFKDQKGINRLIKDWITFVDSMDWKLRHLAASVGLLDLYERQALNANDLVGKRGELSLGIRDYNGENRNFVLDYVKTEESENFQDKDLPF